MCDGLLHPLPPLAGVLIAWVLLKEPLGLEFLLEAGLVLAGAYLVTTKTSRMNKGMANDKGSVSENAL